MARSAPRPIATKKPAESTEPTTTPADDLPRGASEHVQHHALRRRAQRHTDANLACALRDREGHQRVDACCREQQDAGRDEGGRPRERAQRRAQRRRRDRP